MSCHQGAIVTISNFIARAYVNFTGLLIGIIALTRLCQPFFPSWILSLPPAFQALSPLCCALFFILSISLLLYLKAPRLSRLLALCLIINTLSLLLAQHLTYAQRFLTQALPSVMPLPAELNTGALSLLTVAGLSLLSHPAVFTVSLGRFILTQALCLGLLSASLVMTFYSWLTATQLIRLPLGIALCLVGHSLGLLGYRIYTRALIPPTATGRYRDTSARDTYQSLLANSAIGVWELNLHTHELRMDQQTLELYGLKPKSTAFTLQDWLAIVHADDVSPLSAALQSALYQPKPIDLVFRTRANHANSRHIRLRAQQLRSSHQPDGFLLGISFDVTHDIQQAVSLHQLNAMLLQYAYYDALTGLMNRHAFSEAAQRALAEAERRKFKLAGFFIDLDWFKAINDIHGHRIGDKVLVAVAKRILRLLRTEDMVCRLGGDEFFALLGHIHSPAQAKHIAEQLIKDIQRPIHIDGLVLQVGASIGIACFPEDAATIPLLMARADEAMQHAKHQGKGRCACYPQ